MARITKRKLPYTLADTYDEIEGIFDYFEDISDNALLEIQELQGRVADHVADATDGSAGEINALRDALIAAGLMAENGNG